ARSREKSGMQGRRRSVPCPPLWLGMVGQHAHAKPWAWHPHDPPSFPLIGEREILELDGLVAVAGVGEELFEQVADQARFDAIEIVLAVAAEADEACHAQECEVMADGGLCLVEQV